MTDIEKIFSAATGEIERILSTKTVIGSPVTVNGKTIIPLISVGFGFGYGGGSGKEEHKGGEGGGVGGGGGVRPVALIIADDQGVRVENLKGGASAAFEKIAEGVGRALAKRAEEATTT